MTHRKIIHLDMDAFYASVEEHDEPSLRGRPIIVGGTSNRGVVSAASYAARKFGIHSGMPIATARKLCPHGVFLPVRMGRYQEISNRIMEIFHRFTPLVEPISLDEAFLDVTDSEMLLGRSEEIARTIKRLVREETGLTVSAGIASSKLLAKIASDLDKPDGLTMVEPGKEREFLSPLPIKKLWGAGAATQKTLALMGAQTIGDLSRLPLQLLTATFGKSGLHLHLAANGIDDREVITEHETKSIGNEETFERDLREEKALRKELLALATRVGKRLRRHGLAGKTVTLKVKYADFKQITRSTTLSEATADDRKIFLHGCKLLTRTQAGQRPVRLIGISISNLTPAVSEKQLQLFNHATAQADGRRKLYQALDAISGKYGSDAIVPGALLDEKREEEE
jgi:DNA polymerase-4